MSQCGWFYQGLLDVYLGGLVCIHWGCNDIQWQHALTDGLTHNAIPIGGLPSCYATREQHLQYIPTSTKL